ncbi:MAG: ATP-grasp domain-containing protein [Ruminococcaceae bacterium]|nr:ATP-grasp domain-containing protein [Oscillospiraceae bacterium]
MKIVLTSVGRRVELVQAFRNAAEELHIELTLIGADITETAPALVFCDEKRIVPRIRDEAYLPTLLDMCREENVDCLIPTIDTDLLLLAQHKSQFESLGTKVLVASAKKVQLCRDKNLTSDYFMSLGLRAPKSYHTVDTYEGGFPAFIKPKDGSSSVNAFKANTEEELRSLADRIEDYVIQPFVDGKEYTVDVFCRYDGEPVFITPRERMAVRAGEVLKTKIVQDKTIIEEIKALVSDFKPSGAITVQLIRDEKTGIDYYIEINPRFGGGSPLSMKAGADSSKAILQMLAGESLPYVPYAARDGEIYSRYDQSICVKKGLEK